MGPRILDPANLKIASFRNFAIDETLKDFQGWEQVPSRLSPNLEIAILETPITYVFIAGLCRDH